MSDGYTILSLDELETTSLHGGSLVQVHQALGLRARASTPGRRTPAAG